jgi:hypothetical protein
MKEKIKPQAWILELLSGLQDQIGQAGLVYESHAGGSGFAFLRDRLAGSMAEERPVTRFHSARGFLEESIERCRAKLQGNPDDEQLIRQTRMRELLFQWIEEAETLYEQQGKPVPAPPAKPAPKPTTATKLEKPEPDPVEPDTPAVDVEPVPLSFLNEAQADSARSAMEAILKSSGKTLADEAVARELLEELQTALVHAEPEVSDLCQQAIGCALSLDGAVCNVFAVMSGQDITAYQRAWLSSLGSFLVQCKTDWATLAREVPEQPTVVAREVKEEPTPVANEEPPVLEPPAEKPAATDVGLTPKLRQQLKHKIIDAFAAWDGPDAAWSEGRCLEELKKYLGDLGIGGCLVDSLEANDFVRAQAMLEGSEVKSPEDRKLQRQGKMLLQDVQTGYVQRLRKSLGLQAVLDPELREKSLAQLLGFWQKSYDAAEGNREAKRSVADQATINAWTGKLLEELQSDSCKKFLGEHVAGAEGIEALCVKLGNQSPKHPLVALFRSQLKGYLEDIDLMLAFGTSVHAGWAKLFVILSHQKPRSESELVAILARKIDTLKLTLVHENFLNPTLNLRLGNFINWVENGYLMSPSFTDTDEEKTLLANLGWLLKQLAGLKLMDADESCLDDFLAGDAKIGYAIFGPFILDVGRRFEVWRKERANKRS